ncbi:MAG: amidase [Acidimicrobiales bacterium]|nr:amidase [Acidimicrobiales bacterium]MYD82666.1 amidase [Acidimicrobiales bacterium]MYJ65525.1 amidase [Acidimicrobiales bacterium]
MAADDFAYATTMETAAAIAAGDVSSRELLDAALARVERLDGPINAVVALDAERARAAADAADAAVARGDELGPLHGVPVTIKDSFQTEGLVTTSGAPALADFVPERDADPVARYKAAGAVVFAKTNLPLFAGDAQSYNEVYGTTANPYNVEHTPGGSSGGSGAALAAGYTPLELGSDIGGSIRIPSHWSGVTGHKPSYGVVSALGQIPGMPGTLSQADIAVAGPMARDVDDLEMALDILAGPDAWNSKAYSLDLPPARHRDISDFRVAVWLDEELCPIDSQYRELLLGAASALEQAGARVDTEAQPSFTFEKAVDTFLHLLSAAEAGTWTLAQLEEIASSSDEPQGDLGIWYAAMRHREWLSWHERRLQQRRRWEEFFTDWDVVLLPVTPTAAVRHDHSRPATNRRITVNGDSRPYFDIIKWMGLTGVSWLPATVVPVGTVPTAGGDLPVGVQIAGPFLEDRTTLAVGRFLNEALGGFQRPTGF